MTSFDPAQHPRGGDRSNTGRFSATANSAPEVRLGGESTAHRKDMPTNAVYTFLTEAEMRDALPALRPEDGFPASTMLGHERIFRIDDVHTWLAGRPSLNETFTVPAVAASEYEVVSPDGYSYFFPLTLDQIAVVVNAAQDLHARPADIIARLAYDSGRTGALIMSDGTLTSDDEGNYPWVSPFTAALDPEYMELALEDFIALNRQHGGDCRGQAPDSAHQEIERIW